LFFLGSTRVLVIELEVEEEIAFEDWLEKTLRTRR